jgi:hypothetical protein
LPKPEKPTSAPSLLNRSYRVTAEIEVPQGLANGVRLTMDLGESINTPASLQALHEKLMRRQIRGTNAESPVRRGLGFGQAASSGSRDGSNGCHPGVWQSGTGARTASRRGW